MGLKEGCKKNKKNSLARLNNVRKKARLGRRIAELERKIIAIWELHFFCQFCFV